MSIDVDALVEAAQEVKRLQDEFNELDAKHLAKANELVKAKGKLLNLADGEDDRADGGSESGVEEPSDEGPVYGSSPAIDAFEVAGVLSPTQMALKP